VTVIANSISFLPIGSPHTLHGASTPGPPHTRSGGGDGSLPCCTAVRALARRSASSGMARLLDQHGDQAIVTGGLDARMRLPKGRGGGTRTIAPFTPAPPVGVRSSTAYPFNGASFTQRQELG
jgi:hypothetical protein